MTNLARIQAGAVVELLALPASLQGYTIAQLFPPEMTWVDVSSQPQVALGWLYNGQAFAAPPASPGPAGGTPAAAGGAS